MNNLKIILRANGGQGIGLGHVVRTCSLINLFPKGAEIIVLVNPEIASLTTTIVGTDASVELVECWEKTTEKEVSSIEHYFRNASLVIIDGYRFKEDYLRLVSESAKSVVYIDDTFSNLPVDLVINHAPGVSRENYDLGFATILRNGLKYALLRNSFRKDRAQKPAGNRLLVCIGGVDLKSITPRIISDLQSLNFEGDLDIVLGSTTPNFEKTKAKLLKPSNFKSRIHSGLSGEEMADLMRKCSHAIVPASSVTFECIACGIFPGVGFYVDNQENVYAGFKALGAVFPLGDLNSDAHRQKALAKYLESNLVSDSDEDYCQIIRSSNTRLTRDFDALLSPIVSRQATLEDDKILYEWVCDPVSTKNSKTRKAPSFEDHQGWLKRTLSNDGQLLQLASCSGEPIGQVRLDVIEDSRALVSVAIATKMRGKGIATRMYQVCLRQALSWLQRHRIQTVLAQIRPENIASINIHTSIGFRLNFQNTEDGLSNFELSIPKH